MELQRIHCLLVITCLKCYVLKLVVYCCHHCNVRLNADFVELELTYAVYLGLISDVAARPFVFQLNVDKHFPSSVVIVPYLHKHMQTCINIRVVVNIYGLF